MSMAKKLYDLSVPTGSVSVEYSANPWLRIGVWVLAIVFVLWRPFQTGEPVFVVVRDLNGHEMYREGGYRMPAAADEAARYAKKIELVGMDKALASIRREMNADGSTPRSRVRARQH